MRKRERTAKRKGLVGSIWSPSIATYEHAQGFAVACQATAGYRNQKLPNPQVPGTSKSSTDARTI